MTPFDFVTTFLRNGTALLCCYSAERFRYKTEGHMKQGLEVRSINERKNDISADFPSFTRKDEFRESSCQNVCNNILTTNMYEDGCLLGCSAV
jgi:hypothetical protein